MTATYDTDPNTQTIAAAWASSELGQPDREVRFGFAPTESSTAEDAEPTARRVMIAAGLACGVAASALLGVTLFYSNSSQPAIEAPGNAVIVSSSTAAPAPQPAPLPAPKPVESGQHSAPIIVTHPPQAAPVPPPAGPPPATPPGDTTVVIDVPIPDLPDNPGPQNPQPPKPEDPNPEPPKPPVPPDLDFKLPDPPKPKPDPPISIPDLTLAPKPPKPPILIDPVFAP